MTEHPLEGRVLLLENDNKRHEQQIKELDEQARKLVRYIEDTEEIKSLLKNEVIPNLKNLNECKIADEATKKQKQAFIEGPYGKIIFELIKYAFVALATAVYIANIYMAGGIK